MSSLIELRGVSKRYFRTKQPKDVHALKHVNLLVERGDIFGIMGLSGAGKSTLLRCLAMLEQPSLGSIFIQGKEITAMKEKQKRSIRKQIGLVFQHFYLFSSRTVRGNVAYPMEICGVEKEEQGRRISELLGLVGLTELIDVYPEQLSGGQKQRVGIARALANAPEILLCDEATSALDPQTTQEILCLIKYLQRKLGLTVVLITHQMEIIKQVCNKVAILEAGEIVETGDVAEIFSFPKHLVTKKFVEKAIHEIPSSMLSGRGKIFHLHFKGEKADKPILTQMAKKYQVDANILLGWIDSLQTVTVGNLVVELTGEPMAIEEAIVFLRNQGIRVEER